MAEPDDVLPKLGSIQAKEYTFEALHLSANQRLQIEPLSSSNSDPFYTKALGFLERSSLIIKLPTAWNGVTPVNEGETVRVRGFSGKIAYVFNSDVLKVRFAPYPYCHLSFPSLIHGSEIRKALRVQTSIAAQLSSQNQHSDTASVDCTLTDLSAMGCHLDIPVHPGEPGSSVFLNFRFWLHPNEYEVNFSASGTVQNVKQKVDPSGWHCGIRFHGLRASEVLLIQHLVYQHLIEK